MLHVKDITMSKLSNYHTIAIIGTAKNAGKTTALNALLTYTKHHLVAITSIGLDGEKIDQITNLEKPSIHAYKGMIIATAKDTLSVITSPYKLLEETSINTPLGHVVVIKLLTDGDVLLAGPSSLDDLSLLKTKLTKYRLDHLLIDGALFRKSSAASQLSDAIILSTGAALHQNMQKVIHETKCFIKTMHLPTKDIQIIKETKLLLEDQTTIVDINDFLANPANLLSQAKNAKELHIKGAITNRLIDHLIAYKNNIPPLEIIINDFTMINADLDMFQKLSLLGHVVKTVKQVPLLLLTINPYSPYFEGFDPLIFEEEMNKALPHTHILDIKRKEFKL